MRCSAKLKYHRKSLNRSQRKNFLHCNFSNKSAPIVHGVLTVTTIGIQLFCLTCITYVKWKYYVEEKEQKNSNDRLALNPNLPSNRISPEVMQRPSVFVLEQPGIDSESLNTNENQDAAVPGCISVPRISNNVEYNKLLMEIYHLALLAVMLSLRLVAQYVRTTLNTTSLVEWSRLLLCFLDTCPTIFGPVLLPLMIHLSHPEIRNYIKGCFNNQ